MPDEEAWCSVSLPIYSKSDPNVCRQFKKGPYLGMMVRGSHTFGHTEFFFS